MKENVRTLMAVKNAFTVPVWDHPYPFANIWIGVPVWQWKAMPHFVDFLAFDSADPATAGCGGILPLGPTTGVSETLAAISRFPLCAIGNLFDVMLVIAIWDF